MEGEKLTEQEMKEQTLVKEDPKAHRSDLENFRRMRNCALWWKKFSCHAVQFLMFAAYAFFCYEFVFCFYVASAGFKLFDYCLNESSDRWYVVMLFMVFSLAVIITLGVVMLKFCRSITSTLKADTDANRKLNEKIDEKVLGKMG